MRAERQEEAQADTGATVAVGNMTESQWQKQSHHSRERRRMATRQSTMLSSPSMSRVMMMMDARALRNRKGASREGAGESW